VATGWTKPLQYSVAAWYVLEAIYAVTLPFLMVGPMADYVNRIMRQQAQLNPATAPPPADLLSTLTTMMTFGLAIVAAGRSPSPCWLSSGP
jgi:hypothetical protein